MTVANMYVMSSFAIRWNDNRNQLIEDCKRLLMYNNNKINNKTRYPKLILAGRKPFLITLQQLGKIYNCKEDYGDFDK